MAASTNVGTEGGSTSACCRRATSNGFGAKFFPPEWVEAGMTGPVQMGVVDADPTANCTQARSIISPVTVCLTVARGLTGECVWRAGARAHEAGGRSSANRNIK